MEDIIRHSGRGMTPVEVIVNNLCSEEDMREEIFKEISLELSNSSVKPHAALDVCLKILKKYGLVVY